MQYDMGDRYTLNEQKTFIKKYFQNETFLML